jgi:hypothetical protein
VKAAIALPSEFFAALAARWHAEAEVLRRRGCLEAAALLDGSAGELEDADATVQEDD